MSPPKKSPAQLDREIAEVIAQRRAERLSSTTASGAVRKLLGKARSIVTRLRDDDRLRDETRAIGSLEGYADAAITAAERQITTARLPVGYEEIWASRLADAIESAERNISNLRALRNNPAAYAVTARQRFSETTTPGLATALYYISALDALVPALRRIESMTTRTA